MRRQPGGTVRALRVAAGTAHGIVLALSLKRRGTRLKGSNLMAMTSAATSERTAAVRRLRALMRASREREPARQAGYARARLMYDQINQHRAHRGLPAIVNPLRDDSGAPVPPPTS